MTTRSRPGAGALRGLWSCGRRLPTLLSAISLYVDIGQGAGLAGATGIRPFLPPLLAGALARGDTGLDFSGTGWGFLESPAFLLAVLALALASYGAERSGANRRALELVLAVAGLLIGALLFAGSLAAGDGAAWPGLLGGALCAALAWAAAGGLFERARRRLQAGAAAMVVAYADGAALLLAAVAIVLPPASFLALALFILLLVRGRREGERKYAGLRVLR